MMERDIFLQINQVKTDKFLITFEIQFNLEYSIILLRNHFQEPQASHNKAILSYCRKNIPSCNYLKHLSAHHGAYGKSIHGWFLEYNTTNTRRLFWDWSVIIYRASHSN